MDLAALEFEAEREPGCSNLTLVGLASIGMSSLAYTSWPTAPGAALLS